MNYLIGGNMYFFGQNQKFYDYLANSSIFEILSHENTKKHGLGILRIDYTLYLPKSSGESFSRYSAHFFPSSLLSNASIVSLPSFDFSITFSST